MYKDKQKQRKTDAERQRRYRRDKKGVTGQGVTHPNIPTLSVTEFTKTKFKRGKDIKCFEDLPADVQHTIDRISESEEEKRRRTAIAIRYQHTFPDNVDKAVGSMNETSDLNLSKAFCAETGGGEGVRPCVRQ